MTNNNGMIVSGPGDLQPTNETASTAVAAQARAAIEARWVVAMRRPRDLDMVRDQLLRECRRPSFAHAARYLKPIGEGVEGLSIRFVEQALQIMGNTDTEAITIYDDDQKRIVEVRVTDFERNICHRKQITVRKTVERKFLRKNQAPISCRTNSFGESVYLVEATDDDLLNKESAMISKALRTCGLRLIPSWLQDESEQVIIETVSNQAARDPDAEKKRLADAFAALNVSPDQLKLYLGHDLNGMGPSELVELRAIHQTIKDGQTTWQATIERRAGAAQEPTTKTSKAATRVRDKIQKDRATKQSDVKETT